MRIFLSLILLFAAGGLASAQDTPNKSAQITLPADVTISTKQRTLKIVADTAGAKVKWKVINSNAELKPDFDVLDAKSIRLQINDADDVLLVLAWTAINGDATDAVEMVVTVKSGKAATTAPTPAPTDAGNTQTAPKSGKLAKHISFIIDPNKQTAQAAAVLNDNNLRKYFADNGVILHSPIDVTAKAVVEGGLIVAVAKAGGAPCVVIQDATGNILDQAPITDAASVQKLLAPYTR